MKDAKSSPHWEFEEMQEIRTPKIDLCLVYHQRSGGYPTAPLEAVQGKPPEPEHFHKDSLRG